MINTIIFIAIAIIYAVLKIYLEKRFARQDAVSEERRLADLAFACGCSEFELFELSGANWNISRQKIAQDFKGYVKSGYVPPYVRDTLRQHPSRGDQTYQKLIFSGGRPPYL